MSSHARSVFALAALAALLPPAPAGAYCYSGSFYTAAPSIRVLVHPALASELQHPDGTVWTGAEVDRSVWHMVSAINESANANIPFVYFDYINDPSCTWLDSDCSPGSSRPELSCLVPGAIVILPSNCTPTSAEGFGVGAGGLIHISRSRGFQNDPMMGVYQTHGWWGPGSDNFEMTILHEMGHTLALEHPNALGIRDGWTCSPLPSPWPNSLCPAGATGCPLMGGDRGTGYSALQYGVDDINGLQAYWGERALPSARNFEDADLTTATFGELPMADLSIAGYLSASSRSWQWRSSVTLAGLRRVSGSNNELTAFAWNWDDGAVLWTANLSTTTPVNGPVGATETVTHRVVAGHAVRSTGDAVHWHRRLYEMRSPLTTSGTSWTVASTNPPEGTSDDTATAGVGSAYDPTSQIVIHAIRDNTGQVLLIGRGTSWSTPVPTGVRSYVSPAIACAPSTCMLAVVEAMRPAPGWTSNAARLQWREFTWSQSGSSATWYPGTLFTSSWSMTGGISAAAVLRPGGGAWDFAVTSTFIQYGGSFGSAWGTRTYVYRHPAGSTTMSLLLPAISETANEFSFSPIGGTGVYAESFLFSLVVRMHGRLLARVGGRADGRGLCA